MSKPSGVRGIRTGEPGTQGTSKGNVQDDVQEASTQARRFTRVLFFLFPQPGTQPACSEQRAEVVEGRGAQATVKWI